MIGPVTAHELARYATKEIRVRVLQQGSREEIVLGGSTARKSPAEPSTVYLQEAVGFAVGADFVLRK